MPVTKQTYTATPTWTAAQLADLFRSAFIDAGLMTDWHDSFLSGSVENRVLRVQHDAAKAYGTTFYWFMFRGTDISIHYATGWNTSTKVPTGTLYLDHFWTTTNNPAGHFALAGVSTANTVKLVRYTSQADTAQSWFVFSSSTTEFAITIASAAQSLQGWLNLDRGFFPGLARTDLSVSSAQGRVSFRRGPSLRRDLLMGCALVGSTTAADYTSTAANQMLMSYFGVGHSSNTNQNFNIAHPYISLPIGFSSTNPAYSSNSNPVFHSMPYTPYLVSPLPSDFGISFHYATNNFSLEDTLVVNSGVEEWEVLDFANNASAVTGASPLFLARVV